jgi:hypothetical protein
LEQHDFISVDKAMPYCHIFDNLIFATQTMPELYIYLNTLSTSSDGLSEQSAAPFAVAYAYKKDVAVHPFRKQ